MEIFDNVTKTHDNGMQFKIYVTGFLIPVTEMYDNVMEIKDNGTEFKI